jgi:hypothetical protein
MQNKGKSFRPKASTEDVQMTKEHKKGITFLLFWSLKLGACAGGKTGENKKLSEVISHSILVHYFQGPFNGIRRRG